MTKPTISINFRYVHNSEGRSQLKGSRPEIRELRKRYLNGEVEDSVGEVWKAVPCKDSSATYEAIRPPLY